MLATSNAPLLGRDAELCTLKAETNRAFDEKQTRIVTLIGETGVGKSRIITELLDDIRAQPGKAPRVYRAAARATDQSYGVFARLLRARFGLLEGTAPKAADDKVRAEVSKVLDDRKVGDVCFFLGQMIGVRFADSPLTKAVADDSVQAKLVGRAVIKSFFESDASQGPLLLIFEDLEHADDDSVDLLRYLMENLQVQTFLLCEARPELLIRREDWPSYGGSRHLQLDLRPVPDDTAVAIMEELLGRCEGGPPDALVEAAVNLAGGTPGLLHQMVRIFHDSGVLEPASDGKWKVNIEKVSSVRLPLTVDDAVSARIAALSAPDRRLLEHAAAMGSVLWLGGLVALGRMAEKPPDLWRIGQAADVGTIQAQLTDLVERDYLLELPDSAFPGDKEYVFKHNLEREKVSNLTSAGVLRQYHQTVADWLAQMEQVRSQEEYLGMLADHLEQAAATARAGLTYLDAADIARSAYAANKASEYYARGLELLGDRDAARRIDALHNHGDVLQLLGRTDEAFKAFREMLAIAFRLGIRPKGAAAHNRIGRLFRDIGSLSQASEHLQTALELFEASGDERGIASCHDDIGKLLWIRGEYEPALAEMRDSLDRRKKIGDRRSISLSLNNIGLVWMDHGSDQNAIEAFEASLQIRREIGDSLGITQTLNNLGRLATRENDHKRALDLFQEAHDVATEIGERNRIAVVLTNIGEAHDRLGNTDEAVRILTRAEELCDELGDKLHLAEVKRGLAKAYLKQGDLKRARDSIKRAVDLFGQVRSKVHLATALRTLGEVTGAGAWGESHKSKAVDYFMRSIAICKEIGNELEVAKSYKAFADLVFHSAQYKHNADIQREAVTLNEMATEIFGRHKVAPADQGG